MINPDGVVIGNTRTSISGKDLNRVYSDKTDFVFP
jgi:murein tripeptide amidase MpaA